MEELSTKEIDTQLSDKRDRYNLLVDRIKKVKSRIGRNLYDMGLYLIEVKDSELYLLEFASFSMFLEKKVALARGLAYDAIKIAKEFSLVDWQKFGYKKCRLMAKVEKSARADIMQDAESSSVTEIEEKVTEYKLQQGITDTEKVVKYIKPAKEPKLDTEDEREFKGRNDGNSLMSSADRIIELKESWKTKFNEWIQLDYPLPKMKQELVRKADRIGG